MVYLDHAATTFPKPECVFEAMDICNRRFAVNAGRGGYRLARECNKLIEETRELIRLLVHAPSKNVVFAPSITIALNQILKGLSLSEHDHIYLSPYEHNAVARTVYQMEQKLGCHVHLIPVKEDTLEIDLEKLKYQFTKNAPSLICSTHISNVTGHILPVEEIFQAGKEYQAITVLDTAQSLGLIEVDARTINADFIAFAGHKALYGPIGVGGYVNAGGVKLNEVLTGGTGSASLNLQMPKNREEQYEPGSHNIVAIAGLRAAVQELSKDDYSLCKEIYRHEKTMMEYLVQELGKIDGVKMYLPPEKKHIGVLSFNLEGFHAEDVGVILDEDYDIAVRTGYHCAPYVHGILKDEEYVGTVRVGLSRFTTKEEVDALVGAVEEILEG